MARFVAVHELDLRRVCGIVVCGVFPGSDYPANLPSPITPDMFPGMTPGADQ